MWCCEEDSSLKMSEVKVERIAVTKCAKARGWFQRSLIGRKLDYHCCYAKNFRSPLRNRLRRPHTSFL